MSLVLLSFYQVSAQYDFDEGPTFGDRMNTYKNKSCVKSHQFGCYKGYCWSRCSSQGKKPNNKEWCYTTRGRSHRYGPFRCRSKKDCNPCWKCGGPCTD
uniref:Uncharacterized protein n=1 Tax=Tetranychus urticae TaxID=32264 RepID=T1KLV5_TETUR